MLYILLNAKDLPHIVREIVLAPTNFPKEFLELNTQNEGIITLEEIFLFAFSRVDEDGCVYSMQEFAQFYGSNGEEKWENAQAIVNQKDLVSESDNYERVPASNGVATETKEAALDDAFSGTKLTAVQDEEAANYVQENETTQEAKMEPLAKRDSTQHLYSTQTMEQSHERLQHEDAAPNYQGESLAETGVKLVPHYEGPPKEKGNEGEGQEDGGKEDGGKEDMVRTSQPTMASKTKN